MINSLAMVAIASLGMIMPFSSTTTDKATSGESITVTLNMPHITKDYTGKTVTASISASTRFNVDMYVCAYYGNDITHSKLKGNTTAAGKSSATTTLSTSPTSYNFNEFELGYYCTQSNNCIVEFLFCKAYSDTTILEIDTLPFGGLTPPSYTITENKIYEVSGASLSFETEKYNFKDSNFNISEEGNYIDNDFTFSYDTWYTSGFSPSDIYLEVVDHNNVFEYMTKDSNDTFRLPYTRTSAASSTDVVISPAFSDLYVNPYNLQMSDTYQSGFRDSGGKFYFPAYKSLSEIQSCEYNLVMETCLGNDATITVPLQYNCSRQYFGSCSTSDYCVSGGRE